jgi:hypothetical protein
MDPEMRYFDVARFARRGRLTHLRDHSERENAPEDALGGTLVSRRYLAPGDTDRSTGPVFAGRSRLSRPSAGLAADGIGVLAGPTGSPSPMRDGTDGDKYKPLPLARLLSEVQEDRCALTTMARVLR